VSIRDSKAWVQDLSKGRTITTAIDLSTSRRLSDGSGSCLANGACLYSREELLRVDAETRRLSEGSFFARADVAAYQVDLNGENTMQFASPQSVVTSFEGTTSVEGHELLVRVQQAEHTQVYILNLTDDSAKLMTRNGTWTFANGVVLSCTNKYQDDVVSAMSIDSLVDSRDFKDITVDHGDAEPAFIPNGGFSVGDCTRMNVATGNLSSPSSPFGASVAFPSHRDSVGNNMRKLASQHQPRPPTRAERTSEMHAEMMSLMTDHRNPRNQELEYARRQLFEMHSTEELEAMHDELHARRLWKGDEDMSAKSSSNTTYSDMVAAVDFNVQTTTYATSSSYQSGSWATSLGDTGYYSYISHFDLWIATRLADPSFVTSKNYYADQSGGLQALLGIGKKSDISSGGYLAASFALDVAGHSGISAAFGFWSGFKYLTSYTFTPSELSGLISAQYDASTSTMYEAMRKLKGAENRKLATTDFFEVEIKFKDTMDEKTSDKLAISLSKAFYHAMYPGACAGGFTVGEDALYLIGELAGLNAGIDFDDALNFCDKIMGELDSMTEAEEDAFLDSSDNTFYSGDATVTSLMFEYCETLMESDGTKASAGGGALPLKHAHAWASYLKKETPESGKTMTEYVVAFQGTKGNDFSMMQFNNRLQPIAAYWDSKVHIVAEGHYLYMNSLTECLDWFQSTATSSVPTFVTGHSLGGAAATLYAKGKTAWTTGVTATNTFYPRLVTFGAAPTSYAGTPVESLTTGTQIPCDDTAIDANKCTSDCYVTPDAFISAFSGGMSTWCYYSPPESVRFFHKFDPVPSMMMFGLSYRHELENAVVLWDAYDPSCSSYTPGCDLSSKDLKSGADIKDLGLKGTNPDLVKDWICTKTKAVPLTYATKCEDELTSYFTLLNPFPCGYVLLKTYLNTFTSTQLIDGTVDQIDTEGDLRDCAGGLYTEAGCIGGLKWLAGEDATVMYNGMDYDILAFYGEFFKLIDDFETCTSNWVTSIYAHMGAAVGDNPNFGAMVFTFAWIHSAYAMYPLCIDTSSGSIENYIPAGMESSVVSDLSDKAGKISSACTSTKIEACKDFAVFNGYKMEKDPYLDCVQSADCMPIPVKAINTKYSIATSDLVTLVGSDWEQREVEETYMAGSEYYGEPSGSGSGL
jgi:hypothetical protein